MMVSQRVKKFLLLLFISANIGCREQFPAQGSEKMPSHEIWEQLLKKHISAEGYVFYQGFQKDRDQLTIYLTMLTQHPPNESIWEEQDQIAYWINLYNAFTIDLILQHYPVSSIRDIGGMLKIPFVDSAWDIKLISIGDEKYDLNDIEHGILRKKFNEPRIHFALNCASFSCPILRNEAYTGEKLAQQLDEQARLFINDPTKNIITENEVKVSKIFSWYSGDFEKESTLRAYLNQYANTKIAADTKIGYIAYDWSLNEAEKK